MDSKDRRAASARLPLTQRALGNQPGAQAGSTAEEETLIRAATV